MGGKEDKKTNIGGGRISGSTLFRTQTKTVSSLSKGPEVGPCITQQQSRTRVMSKISVCLLLSNVDSVVDRLRLILKKSFEIMVFFDSHLEVQGNTIVKHFYYQTNCLE